VLRQRAQPVGEGAREPPSAADDHHVKELLLLGQVALHLHDERRAGEEVGQQQAEQPVPIPQRLPLPSHRTALPARPRGVSRKQHFTAYPARWYVVAHRFAARRAFA
jgi:hypothetical protein